MDEKGLGKRLQAARQAAGMTQQQLCHKANLSFSTLTKIERGAIKAPSIFTVQAIAGALGQGLEELLGTEGTSTKRQLLKTKSGVSFVYFDVNGCLVHFYQRAFAKLAEETGTPADIIETAFWHYNDDANRGVMTLHDFNTKLAERIGAEGVDWQQSYLETIEPITEMQELMAWTGERYKIGLLTNSMPGMITALRKDGIIPSLTYDAIIDSSEVGAIKPEAHIYEVAQAQSGCPSQEILLIDDSRGNLMAAEKFGWNVLWFDDAHVVDSVERVKNALQPADA